MRKIAVSVLILAALAAGPALADKKGHKPGKLPPGHAIAHCPPGLAKKNPPCVPPGHAKARAPGDLRPGDRLPDGWHRLNDPWRYGLQDDGVYAVLDGHVFRVDGDSARVLATYGLFKALLN